MWIIDGVLIYVDVVEEILNQVTFAPRLHACNKRNEDSFTITTTYKE